MTRPTPDASRFWGGEIDELGNTTPLPRVAAMRRFDERHDHQPPKERKPTTAEVAREVRREMAEHEDRLKALLRDVPVETLKEIARGRKVGSDFRPLVDWLPHGDIEIVCALEELARREG